MPTKPPPSRTPPRLTSVIATTPRTGSHFLAELMANTGRLGRPKEYFNPSIEMSRQVPDATRLEDSVTGSVAWRCGLVDANGTTQNGIASFKLFPNHFQWLLNGVRLSDWFPRIRWIHLYRDDKIGQAISWAIANQTKVWSGKRGEDHPSPTYSADFVEAALLDILADEADWSSYFLRNRIHPFRISYEALEQDPAAAVVAVADHLDTDLEARPDVRTTTVKQRAALEEEWRRRFFEDAGSLDRLDAAFRRRYAPRTMKSLREFLSGRLLVGPIPWRFRED